jgi:predicted ATPase/DNA-binding SARP family transcriptional activator
MMTAVVRRKVLRQPVAGRIIERMGADAAGRWQFRVLGPLEASREGVPIRLAGARQRALLALLLVHANELVTIEQLVGLLFGEQRSRSARNAVRVAVSRLRRSLEGDDAAPVLVTRAGGYVLTAEPEQLDMAMFERLLRDGRKLLAAGDPVSAAERLRDALALWRGAPLADLALVEYLQSEIRRLEELRLAALMERIDADLALGAREELIAELDGLIAAHPLQERLRGQLMLALYRAGRQTEALGVYRDISAMLCDELGLEPSRALQQLERSILQQDASLDAVPRVGAPTAGNLPIPATPFYGRARELAEATTLLSGNGKRLLTLTGAGGSGKTRLALRIAEARGPHYSDGAWFVGFAEISDPELIAPTICQVLGLADQPGVTPARRLQEWLRERKLLLLLDNLEQLITGASLLGDLLARCPGLVVLATSREPLNLAGEQQYAVPVLERADAIELFTSRARAVTPRLNVAPDLAAMICERLDCLPLAIELAAARTKALAPAEILDRLQSRLPVLGTGPRDAPRRQRTLEAAIAWSYDLLDEPDGRVARSVAVLPAPFTLQTAERVAGGEEIAESIVALVDKSILTVIEDSRGTRYRMLETLREFALRRLAEAGEEAVVRASYLDWALELVEAAARDSGSRPRREVLPPIQAEYRNLVSALACEGALIERVRLATGMAVLLGAGTSLPEIQRLLEDVLNEAGHLNTAEVRRARLLLARALRARGELDGARAHLAAAAAQAKAADDGRLGAEVAVDRAFVEVKASDFDRARAFLAEADRLGTDPPGQVFSSRLLIEAQMWWMLGELDRACELYASCIDHVRRHGPPGHLIWGLAGLAELSTEMGDLERADACAREVLAIADPVDDGYYRAGALLTLGRVALRHSRADEAAEWLTEGARLDLEQGSMGAPEMLESLAQAIASDGRQADAATLLGVAAALRERLGLAPAEQEQRYIDATLAAVRSSLSEPALLRLLNEGRRLTEHERLTLVLRQAPARN